jgi:small subunit ribosomal protein S5
MEENKTVAPVSPKADVKPVDAPKAVAPKMDAKPADAPKTDAKAPMNRGGGHFAPRFGQGQGQGGFRRPQGGRGNYRGRNPEEKLYDEKVVKISRICKVIKGGKRVRFSALVVIGDGKGKYGYGLGKSNEVPDAIKKSLAVARRNMFKVTIAKGDTITHPIIGTFGATKVFLKPAPAGTGLIAGGAVRAILELAGVKNIYSKIYGSRTQMNAVRATIDGLSKLKTFAQVEMIRHGIDVTKTATPVAPVASVPAK